MRLFTAGFVLAAPPTWSRKKQSHTHEQEEPPVGINIARRNATELIRAKSIVTRPRALSTGFHPVQDKKVEKNQTSGINLRVCRIVAIPT